MTNANFKDNFRKLLIIYFNGEDIWDGAIEEIIKLAEIADNHPPSLIDDLVLGIKHGRIY